MDATTRYLLQSLIHGPLLIEDLPEASTFARERLEVPKTSARLDTEKKLGHLYEDALATLLEASPEHDLLERNLQLHDSAGSTLGELDFLVYDRLADQLIHLELATKFYLAVPTESGLALPGPDARDTYFRKLRSLRERQLLLARTHRAALPPRYQQETIIARSLIHGCLFDPIDETEPCAPDHSAPNCRRGRWLAVDEIEARFATNTKFQIIPKTLWPVPLEFLIDVNLPSWNPKQPITRCVMLRIEDDPTPYFVTPIGYPHSTQATPSLAPPDTNWSRDADSGMLGT